jgi:hypothetical protein
MRFAALRLRFLTVMGVPAVTAVACHASSPPPQPSPAPVDVATVPTTEPDAAATPLSSAKPAQAIAKSDDDSVWVRPDSCAVDEVRDTRCGATPKVAHAAPAPYADCPTSPSELKSFGFGSAMVGDNARMSFDPWLTARWRDDIHSSLHDPTGYCCFSRCTKLDVAATATRPPGGVGQQYPGSGGYYESTRCLTGPEKTLVPAKEVPACPAAMNFHQPPMPDKADPLNAQATWRARDTRSGSKLSDSVNRQSCCYTVLQPVQAEPRHPRGRLLVEQGQVRVAQARTSNDWTAKIAELDLAGMTPATRESIATRWSVDAAYEHASVAAFSRVSLALLAFGAPPQLVADVHRAALQEIEHARVSYALASRYAGAPIGPGPLAMDLGAGYATLVDLAIDTLLHGCVGETVAAEHARRSAETAQDPVLRALFSQIAEDEEDHAALAFRLLAWAVQTGGENVARAVAAAGIQVDPQGDVAADHTTPSADGELASHGMLCPRIERDTRARVVEEVVRPCLQGLLEHAAPSS